MKLRFYNFYAILALILLSGTGCEKELELAPFNAFTDESVFTTPERALLALNGVYDGAQTGIYPGGQRGYPFGAANVQQGDCRGEDVINIAAFYQFTYQGTYNATTLNNNGMFNSLYNLINRANVAIDGFQKASASGVLSSGTATQFIAESRFLRAYAHLELVIHFCRPYLDGNGSALGIPYRDFPVNSSSAVENVRTDSRPRVDSVYNKIIRDLNFAESNLPVATAASQVIRATRTAAIALKMRVYMNMGNWAQVRTEGNKLVPATVNPLAPTSVISVIGNHSLTTVPEGSFRTNSLSSENLFTIRNDALDNPGVNGALPAMLGAANLGARGLVAVSPIIWNNPQWRADDLRRSNLYVAGTNANSGASIFTVKYTDYVNRGDNNPHIRWAEVLLMQAEAEARLDGGVSQRAIDLLNTVRNRSIPSASTNQYTTTNFADRTELLNAILLERRIEFLLEGKRWFDIHRLVQDPITALRPVGIPAKLINGSQGAALYGIGVPVTAGQPAIPYSDFRFIWPIPVDEVTQNPVFVQNPGY
jgi:starch-binding outer membrane protein, SusD/RagB family